MRTINFHNIAHLGDCLYQIHYMNKCVEKNEISFNFYCNDSYFNQLNEFIKLKDRIRLIPLSLKPSDSIDCWITRPLSGFNNYFSRISEFDRLYDLFYVSFFTEISKLINIESPINKHEDMLFDNKELLNDSDLSKEIDFLFINSRPMSGQFMDFNINKINNIISELKEIGSVVTTAPNNQGVPCTLDYKLSLMGIGNLSIYSKNIISVMTSPIIPCFNVFNVNKFESFIVLENGQSYSHNKRIKNINKLDDVLEYYKK